MDRQASQRWLHPRQRRAPDAQDYDWEANEHALPRKDSAAVQQHLEGRRALIVREKEQRSDHAFRKSLSPDAAKACAIVAQIRAEEQQTTWRAPLDDPTQSDELYPGMMFSLAKERMEATKLFSILSRFPKGTLLHAHMGAMVDLDCIIHWALTTPGIHMRSPVPLHTAQNRHEAAFSFVYSRTASASTCSIWSPEYSPTTLIPASETADTFPNGGREGFTAWVKDRCSITQAESISHHYGVDDIWRKFSSAFPIISSITYYEPIYRKFLQRLFTSLVEDGVQWIDVREAYYTQFRREGHDEPEVGYEALFRVLDEELIKFKASEKGRHFWGARVIWTSLRIQNTNNIISHMKQCIDLKKKFPHLISGYDLVGQEDLGRPLKDVIPELLWFREECQKENLEIPFLFHAGECLGDGDDTDENLFDAIVLGTRRIGHGFSLYKHPLLIDLVKEKKILIESCPISNEILRLSASILSHPLPALLSRNVPTSLCNDDPAILGQDASGMTHDFWQALQGWQNLGLAGLGSLAENSVRWALFEDQNGDEWLKDITDGAAGTGLRARRMREWKASWEIYCQWIKAEYGEKYST
ncbi:MAG: hypothetical protein M1818_005514 [Claussenomyces sp. TS43310]|nr:MAG: hypothetical protein M1818_005514 [Claussenomyces sp. TS43310]